ncbi:hypothetical protein HOP57_16220 [Halomonas daqingensis]|nr:hypothetical protein [Halomonas desiderata]
MAIALRAVETIEFMTARWAHLSMSCWRKSPAYAEERAGGSEHRCSVPVCLGLDDANTGRPSISAISRAL